MDEITQLKYVVAFCYGDGGVYQNYKNCRFVANASLNHKEYVEWRASILSNITKVTLREYVTKVNGKEYLQISTKTRAHPIFTKVRHRMYLNGRKVIDPHYLKLFDWETLAILHMDDGSADVHGRAITPTVRLATLSFSYADNWLLKKAIKNNLGIEFNVKYFGQSKIGDLQYCLKLPTSEYVKFREGVKQYILPSFEYKIPVRLAPKRILGEDKVQSLLKNKEVNRNDLLIS